MIDCMMADHHNIQKLRDSLQEAFDNDPLSVFQDVIRPLIPTSMLEETGEQKSTPEQMLAQIREMLDSVG
jgi:hypothetical protein